MVNAPGWPRTWSRPSRLVFGLEVKQIGKHGFLLVVTVSMIVLVVTIMVAAMSPELRVDGGLCICRLLGL